MTARAKDKEPRTEIKRPEDRGQRSAVRRQMSDVRNCNRSGTEDRDRRSEDRGQMTDDGKGKGQGTIPDDSVQMTDDNPLIPQFLNCYVLQVGPFSP